MMERFFFSQSQLQSPSTPVPSSDDTTQTINDDNIQHVLASISLDDRLDSLKKDILFEIKQQEAVLNDISHQISKSSKDNIINNNNNNNDIISLLFDIPMFFISLIWKTIGIIPYLGPLLQLLIIINIICFILSLLPSDTSSYLLMLVKYIIFSIIPILFKPLVNACKAVVYDSGFIELRHYIAFIIANIKDLLLSDMFQGVYNTKILSSISSSINMTAASEVLFDGTTMADSYSFLKDSLSKLYK